MKTKSWLKEYGPYLAAILVILLIRIFIATPVRVSGNSMSPTLADGEIMILNKLAKIDRYDIVVVSKTVAGDEIIKRVIALPGETIERKDNVLLINDEEVEDIYGDGMTEDFKKVFLGADEYWVMGDNRSVSMDSRVFGKIKTKEIKGVTDFVIYPFDRFGKVNNS